MESYLFVAMYIRGSSSDKLPSKAFIDEVAIENLARNTIQIFVGAYDQEGLVVWSKE